MCKVNCGLWRGTGGGRGIGGSLYKSRKEGAAGMRGWVGDTGGGHGGDIQLFFRVMKHEEQQH